jgi:UDP-glucuronate 4-epimerase
MIALVTGACGFIGTNLCLSLLDEGHKVIGVDAFTNNYGRDRKVLNKSDLQKYANFKLLEIDLLVSPLEHLLENIDVVYHLAGHPSVQNSWGEDFKLYIDRNILLTQRLLRAAAEVECPKFVNSSSSSIYGRAGTTPTVENSEKIPISPYGVTKLAAENLVTLFGSEFGLNTISLRYFTVFGPRQRPDMAFNKLIRAGLEGSKFPLYGDGSQIRDFTFVADVVEANKLAAGTSVDAGSVFNVGGGSPTSMREAISMIEEILGLTIELELQPLGPGNPMITKADCNAAKTLLGWKPEINIYDGLKRQVDWQLLNR